MGWIILELIVKFITGLVCIPLLLIAFIIGGFVSLVDGILYGYWHEDWWEGVPDFLRELWDHYETSIFE